MRRPIIARLVLCISFLFVLSIEIPVADAYMASKFAVPRRGASVSVQHRKAERLGALAQSAWKKLGAVQVVKQSPPRRVTRVAAVTLPVQLRAPRLIAQKADSSVSSSRSASSSSSAASVTVSADEEEVLRLVNVERTKENLPTLKFHAQLRTAAVTYAADMRNRDFFAHVDPEGRTPEDRIKASGYLDVPCDCGYRYNIGENIAKGQTTAAKVVQDWMNSPSHRENILNGNYVEIGIGRSGNYWVQEFGRMTHE